MKKETKKRLKHDYLNGKGSLVNTISISDEVKTALDAMIDGIEIDTGTKIRYNDLIRYMIDDALAGTKDGKTKSRILDKINSFHMSQF